VTYRVELTPEDLQKLQAVLDDADAPKGLVKRARALIDASVGMPNAQIADHVGLAESTISVIRKQFVEGGIDAVLSALHGGSRLGGGGTRKISDDEVDEATLLHAKGVSFRDLARRFDISPEGIRQAMIRKDQEGRSP
jgi:hypothetical protein